MAGVGRLPLSCLPSKASVDRQPAGHAMVWFESTTKLQAYEYFVAQAKGSKQLT
jgi:hypothetical protein